MGSYRTPTLQQYRTIRPVLKPIGTDFFKTLNYSVSIITQSPTYFLSASRSFAYTVAITCTHGLAIEHKTSYNVTCSVPTSAVSGQFNKVHVTAQYVDYDGVPLTGTVTFIPNRWVINQSRSQIVLVKPYTASLNADGKIDILIPASDDTDIIPFDVLRYNVAENIPNGRNLSNVKIPFAASQQTTPSQLVTGDTSTAEGGTSGGWISSVSGTMSVSSTLAYVGSKCHQVTSLVNGTCEVTTTTKFGSPYVIPLNSYIINVYFRPNVTRICVALLNWYTTADIFISQSIYPSNSCSANTYTQVLSTVVAPAFAAKFTMSVRVLSAAIGEIMRFDDITVEDPVAGAGYDLSSITSW